MKLAQIQTPTVNVCRFVLAATFIVSAFTKAIDPAGVALKIQEYAQVAGVAGYGDDFTFLLLALALLTGEFLVGTSLLLGIRRKISTIVAFAFMCAMTPLTLYIAVANPVHDCGCFGDAFHISNWATFCKNVLLLLCAIACAFQTDKITRLTKRDFQWLPPLYSFVFIVAFALYNYSYLPLIDFRPYKIGVDMLHDETVIDRSFYDIETFEEVTDSVLRGYTFLLLSPRIEEADQDDANFINDLYDYARKHGYGFYGVTASDEKDITHWRDYTGADYPFIFGDATMLRTMIRSNPGVMLFKDGVILNKWHHIRLPNDSELTAPLEKLPSMTSPVRYTTWTIVLYALMWYAIPILLILLADIYIFNRIITKPKTTEQK